MLATNNRLAVTRVTRLGCQGQSHFRITKIHFKPTPRLRCTNCDALTRSEYGRTQQTKAPQYLLGRSLHVRHNIQGNSWDRNSGYPLHGSKIRHVGSRCWLGHFCCPFMVHHANAAGVCKCNFFNAKAEEQYSVRI